MKANYPGLPGHPKGETRPRPDYMHISGDGALHDTREVNWHSKPLRSNYARHHLYINTVADYKATLRAGPYAWPGGYPLFLLMSDGEALCFTCGNKEARSIISAIQDTCRNDRRCVACDVNYEEELECANCNKPIPAAYGGNNE